MECENHHLFVVILEMTDTNSSGYSQRLQQEEEPE